MYAAAVGGMAALGTEFLGEVGAFGEGTVGITIGVGVAGGGLGRC
jgi:hypothetical protein